MKQEVGVAFFLSQEIGRVYLCDDKSADQVGLSVQSMYVTLPYSQANTPSFSSSSSLHSDRRRASEATEALNHALQHA